MQSAEGPLGPPGGESLARPTRVGQSGVSDPPEGASGSGSGSGSERAGSWLVVVARSVVVGDRPRPSRGAHTVHGRTNRLVRCPTRALGKGMSSRPRGDVWRSSTTTIARLEQPERLRLGSSETHSLERHSQFSVRRLLVILRVHTYPVIFSRGERRYFECEDSICMCYHSTRREHPKPLTFESIERC